MIPLHGYGVILTILLCLVSFLVGNPLSYEGSFKTCLSDTFGSWNCLAELAMNRYPIDVLIAFMHNGNLTYLVSNF